MAELGYKQAEVKAAVDNINQSASKVAEDAINLANKAEKISSLGIQGVAWYDETFKNMLNKLKDNKVAEAVEEIKLQAQKLVNISEKSETFSNNQG